jgi:hypothetical protein
MFSFLLPERVPRKRLCAAAADFCFPRHQRFFILFVRSFFMIQA